MKITVTSDDGKKTVIVHTDDIDFEGHSLNWAILDRRQRQAIELIYQYEKQAHATQV